MQYINLTFCLCIYVCVFVCLCVSVCVCVSLCVSVCVQGARERWAMAPAEIFVDEREFSPVITKHYASNVKLCVYARVRTCVRACVRACYPQYLVELLYCNSNTVTVLASCYGTTVFGLCPSPALQQHNSQMSYFTAKQWILYMCYLRAIYIDTSVAQLIH